MSEQEKILEILDSAIQLESDGEAFYEEAALRAADALGKDLFNWLAKQEQKHKKSFERIYGKLKEKKNWPNVTIKPADTGKVDTIFSKALAEMKMGKPAPAEEVEIIDKGISLEHKTYDMYSERSKTAASELERGFFSKLAAEENSHYQYLVDYKEYVTDPVDYFTKAEKHSLDAGG
jgi:rubrerythrin